MLKKIRLRTIFVFLLAGLSGALLLHTSQNVQKTEAEMNEISAAVTREEESIRLLKTEWAYLNNPARLETLARQYLKLQASDPAAIKTDGKAIPAKPLPEDMGMQAQPVSLSPPVPPTKPNPPSAKPPKEKNFNELLNNVAQGNAKEGKE